MLGANVNTDIHCSAKYMAGKETAYLAQRAVEPISPDVVARFNFGNVIVAGKNSSINSPREQAIQVMRLIGVATIAAPSFGRQFFRDAFNNGLSMIECDTRGVENGNTAEIDLARCCPRAQDCGIERAFARLPKAIQGFLSAGG